jgi:hypothetical protein
MRHWVPFLFLFSATAMAFDLSGTVLDPSGRPVAAARVWISQDRQVRHVDTDAGGAFSFSDVQPKPAELIARKEGLSLGGAVLRVVGSGTAPIRLCDPAALPLRIRNADHEPVAGARIRTMFVADSFNVPVDDLDSQGFPPIRSDEGGHLTIPELPKGTHVRFVVGHRSYADAAVAYLPVREKEQTIVLYPGMKLRGRVTVAPGSGVPRARVAVLKIGEGAQRQAGEALTDPEGFYNVTVAPGDYFVAVRHPNYASPRSRQVTVREDTEDNIADFVLQPPFLIEGSVLFPDGKAVPGAPVSYWVGPDMYEEVLTQWDGRFRIQTPQEDGRIRIIPPDGFMTENLGDISVSGAREPHVALAPIRVKPLPAVDGAVVDGEGHPAPNVLISSLNLDPKLWLITDADGRFHVQLGQAPPDGKASFRAEHALRFLRADFEAVFPSTKPVRVALKQFEPDIAEREVHRGENNLSPLIGQPAPEIVCAKWFNSEPLTLGALRGKVVVAVFWSAFDKRGPVRDAIEELRALYDLLKDGNDMAILCVHDAGSEPDEIEQSVKEFRIPFPVGRDADSFQTFEKYLIRYIPQTVLIDRHGLLRYFHTDGRLLELIKSLRREG